MTRINLLDWRAERREQHKREFFAMLAAGVLVGVLVVLAIITAFSMQLDDQNGRNRLLKAEIAEAQAKLVEIQELEKTRANLTARMNVIEQLQASRSASVHLFDELVKTLPDGVSLTSVRQEKEKVTIDGVAESNTTVSNYMNNLDASPFFNNPDLVVIRSDDRDGRIRESRFTLKVSTVNEDDDKDAPKPGARR